MSTSTSWGASLLSQTESGLSSIFSAFTADTGLSNLETAVSNWWQGTPGTPLAPLGAKTYAGAVGAGIMADTNAAYSLAQGTVAAGSAAGSAIGGVTSALSSSMGPILIVLAIIVIAVLVIKT
jgi:hypothetical protein